MAIAAISIPGMPSAIQGGATPRSCPAIGAENFLLGTDLGQTGNPSPPDGYAMLVAGLMAEGITKDQIKIMGREVPGTLLMG